MAGYFKIPLSYLNFLITSMTEKPAAAVQNIHVNILLFWFQRSVTIQVMEGYVQKYGKQEPWNSITLN